MLVQEPSNPFQIPLWSETLPCICMLTLFRSLLFERDAALAAIPHNREEADATLAVREPGLELSEFNLAQRASQNR